MEKSKRTPLSWWLLLFSTIHAGCAALRPLPAPLAPHNLAVTASSLNLPAPSLQRTSFEMPAQRLSPAGAPNPGGTPFAGTRELSVDALVEQVVTRNPSLAQMTAAWQAASTRYPQVTALDDPMFGVTLAPASIGSDSVEFGYRVEVSQKLPFPGKLGLRGRSAQAEAEAARDDVDDMRLQLIESAKSGFYEYYWVARASAVNDENVRLLKAFRAEAKTRYEKGLVPEQDVLQADVELGRQRERSLTLSRMRKVAVARINTLMHLPPDVPLPPPPEQLTLGEALPPAEALRSRALSQRPDLQALANRVAADEAALQLAQKEFRPDFEVMAAYDTIMGNGPTRDLAPQLGVRLNLPIRKGRRYAAIAEVQARIAERRAQLDSRIDQVNLQLQEAYEQVAESEQIVRLYEKTILPAARSNVDAARSAYETGKVPFLSLIEAQRNRVGLLDRSYEALADYYRRKATLERVVGGPLPPSS